MFTRLLHTVQIGHEQWQITKSFEFHSSTGLVVAVPKNFTCDLASIPAFAQAIIPKVGYYSQSAVCHDWLYREHREGRDSIITRRQADRILMEGCTVRANDFNVPRHKRRTRMIYLGVRAGGLESWETPEERADRLERIKLDDGIRDL